MSSNCACFSSAKPGAEGEARQSQGREGEGRAGERRPGRGRAWAWPKLRCAKVSLVRWPPVVEARCSAAPSASRMAETTVPRTWVGSRNRTSALAGWTLTSTRTRLALQEQRDHRVTVTRHMVHVAGPDGGREQLVAHRAAIDEKILAVARRAVKRSAGR